ncbi:MAG: serine/threonine protein kinase [Oscillibacter sp.]|nr:serine/threonine protein kinase [Oscillibacter sp.]
MSVIAEAVLADGRKLPYVVADDPPRGGMKYTYFAPDKSYVVQFFNDPMVGLDPNTRKRLDAIIGRYNPTRPESEGGAPGNSAAIATYFSGKFCWPTAIVRAPEFGIVCPAYPSNFFFTEEASTVLPLKGKDKRSRWFTSFRNRQYLELEELGDFRAMLQMSISLARSIRRMHQAGLAHSDLSCNNVLIDPKSGSCVVIDIDSLVVPGLFPPEVVGTHGYIAPEVMESLTLPPGDPNRKLPSSYTDLHALAVLLYEYLLLRHPLEGPKIYSPSSPEEDDFLAFGPKATFIENPHDTSNRPPDLPMTIHDLGPYLEKLFLRAFVDGLHHPDERPTAMEWEKGLVKTWDLLHPCENPECAAGWFILHDLRHPVCPFCGTPVKRENLLRLHLKSPLRGRIGQWMHAGEVAVYHNMPLFKWHILANTFPDEKADREMQAYICKHQGQWLLVNYKVQGMTSPRGSLVPTGQAILLRNGTVFRASNDARGFLIEVTQGQD